MCATLLKGGLSWLTDLYGLVCDNVINYEVVLADGSLVHANADDNEDLFWALKGGGNNFGEYPSILFRYIHRARILMVTLGIVTCFTFATYPIPEIWGGVKIYAWDQLPGLLTAMNEYQSAPNKDPYANAYLQGFPSNRDMGLILTLVYFKPEANPAVFAPFANFTPQMDQTKFQTTGQLIASYPQIPVAR